MSAGEPTRWGWHQLDPNWARRLVAESGVGRGDLVLDIGAGTGALTRALLDAGARVVAVELHPTRAAALRNRFPRDRVIVVQADAADLRLPRQPFHVVANPPFAITTAVLRRLLSPGTRLVRADLVLPAGLARRWAGRSAPGHGRWHRDFEVRMGPRVPARAFRPTPPVAAAVMRVERVAPAF